MLDLGTVKPGATLYIPFHTFDSNDPSASVTLTGLAVTDIEIYKDGNVVQRASDSGYALLDTDGIDFDGTTGIHGFSIDLADNTTAEFYAAGSQYWVVVASVTVDAGVVNFIAATFRIGYENAILDTTINTLASQTSFTLNAGSTSDDAYNNATILVHDVALAKEVSLGRVSDYTGATKTITMVADPSVFTVATTDNVSIFAASVFSNMVAVAGTAQTAGDIPALVTTVDTVVDGIAAGTTMLEADADNLITESTLHTTSLQLITSATTTLSTDIDDLIATSTAIVIESTATAVVVDGIAAGTTMLEADADNIIAETTAISSDLEKLTSSSSRLEVSTTAILADTGTDGVVLATDSLDAAALSTDAVDEIWTVRIAELSTAMRVDPTVLNVMAFQHMSAWNQHATTATSGYDLVYNDAGAVIFAAALTADTTEFIRAQYTT